MKFKVIITVGYYDAWFEFDTVEEAWAFAETALLNNVQNDDTKIRYKVNMRGVEAEEAADE